MYFHEVVRLKRKALNLSQKDLADKCGLSLQMINRCEQGAYSPSLIVAQKLGLVLNISLHVKVQDPVEYHEKHDSFDATMHLLTESLNSPNREYFDETT